MEALGGERKRGQEALEEYSEWLEGMVEQRTQELHDAQEHLVRRESWPRWGNSPRGRATNCGILWG